MALALTAFGLLVAFLPPSGPFAFDQNLQGAAQALRSDSLTAVMRAVTRLGGGRELAALTVAGVLLLLRPAWRWALFFGLAVVGAGVLNQGLKWLFARTRPALPDALSDAGGYAFPSGHAMGTAAFALALFFVVRRLFPRRQALAAGIGLVLVLTVGFSRVYLGVHYPTDVAAGWALSTAWVVVLQAWARTWDPPVDDAHPTD